MPKEKDCETIGEKHRCNTCGKLDYCEEGHEKTYCRECPKSKELDTCKCK